MKVDTVLRLVESKSAPLYHGTTVENAETILAANRLVANSEINQDALPYIRGVRAGDLSVSFSRSLSAARAFASGVPRKTGISGVVFVINQELLSQDIGKRLNPYNDLTSNKGAKRLPNVTEYEETVVGDVTNFTKYITKIIVFAHPLYYANVADPEMFPMVFNNPKTTVLKDPIVKDTHNSVDRFASARELELHQARSNNNV